MAISMYVWFYHVLRFFTILVVWSVSRIKTARLFPVIMYVGALVKVRKSSNNKGEGKNGAQCLPPCSIVPICTDKFCSRKYSACHLRVETVEPTTVTRALSYLFCYDIITTKWETSKALKWFGSFIKVSSLDSNIFPSCAIDIDEAMWLLCFFC